MAEGHAAYQPMPLEVTRHERLTKPGLNGDYAEGRFTRDPDFTFAIFFDDRPNPSTYQNTRISEMYIKHVDVTQWMWGSPDPENEEPDWEYGKLLFADLLAGLDALPKKEAFEAVSARNGITAYTHCPLCRDELPPGERLRDGKNSTSASHRMACRSGVSVTIAMFFMLILKDIVIPRTRQGVRRADRMKARAPTENGYRNMDAHVAAIPLRQLSPAQFRALAAVPPETEWFANLRNRNTRENYKRDIRQFIAFAGIRSAEQLREVTRPHVIAWRDHLQGQGRVI